VNDAEAVDAIIPFVFKNHCVDNLFPPTQDMPMLNAEIQDLYNQCSYVILFCAKLFKRSITLVLRIVRAITALAKERFIPAQVSAGRGRGGGFAPGFDLRGEFL
jgi:hypothetical protein